MSRSILAETNRASPHLRIAKRPGHKNPSAEPHSYIPRPNSGPGQQFLRLVWVKVGPFGEGFKGFGVLIKETLERGFHVICEIRDLGSPSRSEARKI